MEQTASVEQIEGTELTPSMQRPAAPRRRRGRLRRLLLASAMAIGMAGTTVMVAAEPAHAEPGHFLYEYSAGIPGPCGSQLSVGSYIGYSYFSPPYLWDTIYVGSYWIGNDHIWEYEDRGFQYGNHYNACHNYAFVVRVYGAATAHRTVEQHWDCEPDFLSCVFHGTTYSDWTSGW